MSRLMPFLGSVSSGIAGVMRKLHENGRDDLIASTQVALLIGAVCSIPAMLVGGWKSIPLVRVFWGVTIATGFGTCFELDDSGGVVFGILTGLVALIYVLVRPDPRKVALNPDAYKYPVFPPILAVVLCLLFLPQVFTSAVTVELPDTRNWLEKLRGDPVPHRVEEVTNWGTVLMLSMVIGSIVFLVARTNSSNPNRSTPPRDSNQ